ncbi:RNA-guided endonuclease InsQ/TnpB family protein, partial [Micromonospora sp. LOL_021]|uniref:RNA-guided endonuclease InsQ/TnpB family protein n=1 Tax=Micromonospora sp. LOL_021 TaxID=3345417 RepID=UPI003A8B12A3
LWTVSRTVKRAFRYRFHPTPGQAAELARTLGCVRLVYNMALAARGEAWTQRQERVTYNATSAMLTGWKKTDELAFLGEVSSVPLQQALRHLQTAFSNFWAKRARYPSFKSRKRSRRSAEYTASAFRWRDGRLTLAKMSAPLDIVWSRPLPEGAAPSTVTVSQDPAGRWFVSLLCDDRVEPAAASGAVVGVDAGLDSLFTLSTGEKIPNPRHERRDRDRLARAQRNLAGKAKGSANRAKARLSVARIHARIADRRRDHLHKLTTPAGGVRPHRESSSRTGRSSAKQEPPGATQGMPVPSGRGGSQGSDASGQVAGRSLPPARRSRWGCPPCRSGAWQKAGNW